jgi:hypothetical protein
MSANFQIVRIRPNLDVPGEVNEFHCRLKVGMLKR